MKNLRLILSSLALSLLVAPAWAEKVPLSGLSNYLNSLKTATAEFTQINDDGTISTGTILIRRPGRIRFEYNPPEQSLVMAGQGQVAIFDSKSNQPPEQFPLVRTPLNLLLAPNINLAQAKMVIGHTSDATTTSVIAQDPKYPEYGSIQMVFTDNPVELRQWIITDGSGQNTTVILGQLNKGARVNLANFNISQEIAKRRK